MLRNRYWLGITLCAAALKAQTGAQTVLFNFNQPPHGAAPFAGVIRDAEGNLYGTTQNGGQAGAGVVYKVDTSGHQKVLYSFTGGADGSVPYAGVIRDSSGNLYGTTYYGGSAGFGVVYKVDPAGNETVLHSFQSGSDGAQPYAGLIRDSAGNLYGTTEHGGFTTGLCGATYDAGCGTIFEIDTSGQETVLYKFNSTGGTDPGGSVIRDSQGNFYGTTESGGKYGGGVIFKVDSSGNETVLHNFGATPDGLEPFVAGVVRDPAGNLYGTTLYGGTGPSPGYGVAYKLSATGQFTVLHTFTGGADGALPYSGLTLDSAGNLYGSAEGGGILSGICAQNYPVGCGVIYKISTSGQQSVLYSFMGGVDGNQPTGGVALDSSGDIYGTTFYGGAGTLGAVFEINTSGQESTLYSFLGAASGNSPHATPMRDSAGNLYGTTLIGGAQNAGVVYKIDTAGHESAIYTFTGGDDGDRPLTGVISDPAGNLYGTTPYGGAFGYGVVYKLNAARQQTVLYAFTNGADGRIPTSVTRDKAGNIYGATEYGGADNAGVLYKLSSSGQFTILHTFTGGADGGNPFAGPTLDAAGNLYGTTLGGGPSGAGVVYQFDTTGTLTPLYSFTGGADGGSPVAGVVFDSAGNLYGTTGFDSGAYLCGVVFKVAPTGEESVLYAFAGGDDGCDPQAGVILDSAGNIYGTTYNGGTANVGVVYELTTSGQEIVLWNFENGPDGGYPIAGVIIDPSGNLYGATQTGGAWSAGVVFKLVP